jgi:hypothetical protein
MSTKAGRFGPKIGGWRSRTQGTVSRFEPTVADMNANLFKVSLLADHGASRHGFYVIAFTDEQADAFARIRTRHEGDLEVEDLGPTSQHTETTTAVLQFEDPQEFLDRKEYFDNQNEAAWEAQQRSDLEGYYGASTPQTDSERTDAAYRQRREHK